MCFLCVVYALCVLLIGAKTFIVARVLHRNMASEENFGDIEPEEYQGEEGGEGGEEGDDDVALNPEDILEVYEVDADGNGEGFRHVCVCM